ncbi:MAG: hypothetical protein PHV20_08275 [Bacteroidales bacterium]|nr:hypothetical protein [Bacteroidales bacterium]
MKTKLLYLLLSLFALSMVSFSQNSKFNLSDYKLPDLKRQTFDLTFNLSGLSDKSTGTTNYHDSKFNSDVRLYYTQTINNRKIQREISDVLAISGQSNSTPSNYTTKNDYFQYAIGTNVTNRMYNEKKRFLEIGFLFNSGVNHIYLADNYSTQNAYLSQLIIATPIKVGVGRIEQVQDARQAIYILDALAKENRVKNNFDKSTILSFAKCISKLKNKRYLDNRVQKIEQIEAIDSFLSANNLSLKTDARFFTTLNDMWDFGSRQVRNSGSRISIGLFPSFNKYADNTDFTYQYLSIHSGLQLSIEKPKSLSIQKSFNAFFLVGTTKTTEQYNSFSQSGIIPNLKLGISKSIGYYPNTRTDITFTYGLNYDQLFGKNRVNSIRANYDNKLVRGNLNLNANYYFSPKLRLTANAYANLSLAQSTDNQYILPDNIITKANFTNNPSLSMDYKTQKYGLELKLTYAFF